MHCSSSVNTLLRGNIWIKSSTCGFSTKLKALKPNNVNTLIKSQSVKPSLNFNRNCSTDESPKKQFTKGQRFIINFVNWDTVFTIAFIGFLYVDYKKYKEEGEGLLIK